jgi:division protein CdvB (Snf7/Vps24/ESCRT-III family)
MIKQITEMIDRKKKGIIRLESNKSNARNEYNEAVMQGMIDEAEMGLVDLQEILKLAQKLYDDFNDLEPDDEVLVGYIKHAIKTSAL